MLFQIIASSGTIGDKIITLLLLVLVMIMSLTVHEYSHGYAAYKLGDSTAKADGRLSLNPLRHLDPVGALMLLIIGFGYAKPVPVITRNFKKPRRDFAIVSIAGPLSNFILAFIGALFLALMVKLDYARVYKDMLYYVNETVPMVISLFLYYFILLNLGLGLFNLIPLPPLDGSNVVLCLLPNRLASKYAQLRRYTPYIWIAVIALSWIPGKVGDYVFYPLTWLRDVIFEGFVGFWKLVFGI